MRAIPDVVCHFVKQVHVEKIVVKEVPVPVDRIVEKMVEIPVDRIVEKRVVEEVEVPKIVVNEVLLPHNDASISKARTLPSQPAIYVIHEPGLLNLEP